MPTQTQHRPVFRPDYAALCTLSAEGLADYIAALTVDETRSLAFGAVTRLAGQTALASRRADALAAAVYERAPVGAAVQ